MRLLVVGSRQVEVRLPQVQVLGLGVSCRRELTNSRERAMGAFL